MMMKVITMMMMMVMMVKVITMMMMRMDYQKFSNGKDNCRSDEHNNGATARNYQTAVKIQTIDSIFPL